MSFQPFVGIALATYKPDLSFLRLQLASLKAQSHQNWFLVVHDDQSVEIEELRSVVHEIIPASQALVIQGSVRRGAVGNFAAALKHIPVKCELIAFCDQDDEWDDLKLEKQVAAFSNSKVMAVHSDLLMIDREGVVLANSVWKIERRDRRASDPQHLIFRNPVTGCTLMFRASLLSIVLPVPEQPVAGAYFFHDVWVALIAMAKGQLVALDEPLVRYRQHGGNVVGAESKSARPALISVPEKCRRALQSRRELEKNWQQRLGSEGWHSLFSSNFNLGLPILVRAIWWSICSSSGYLRIGLQLALGKLLWDLGYRNSSQNRGR